MSKIVKYGGGFLGFCVLLAVAAPPPESDKVASPSQTAVAETSCTPKFWTAESLKSEMEANEARMAHAWKQAGCATVSGVVMSVDSDFMDRPFVVIGSGGKYEFSGIVHCNPKNAESAFSLTKGQSVTVSGKTGGEVMGTLTLDRCAW